MKDNDSVQLFVSSPIFLFLDVCAELRVLTVRNIFYNCFRKQFSVQYIWPLRLMIFEA